MHTLFSYLRDIRTDCGRELPVAAMLVALGALVEGIGVLAILPFAAVIIGNADTAFGQRVMDALSAAGLDRDRSRALALAAAFLLLLCARGYVLWLRDVRLQALGLGYVDRWRSRLFDAVGKADWITVSALRRSDIEHALNKDVSRLAAGTGQLLRSAAAFALSLVQVLILAFLSPLLLALVVALMALAGVLTLPLIRKASRLGMDLTRTGRRAHGVLGDFLAGQKLARLNNAERDFAERYGAETTSVRHNQIAYLSSQAAARGWFQIAAGAVVLCALLVGFFVLQTPLSILAITLLVLARLASPLQMLASNGQMIANTLPAFQSLVELHKVLENAAVHGEESEPVGVPQIPARLSLENVRFAYPGTGKVALETVSLDVGAGEIVALCGPSGRGKTTLLDIACGLLTPESGKIQVDGAPLTGDAMRRQWRDQIAYVPQDPFLFDASLRENILWSANASSECEIEEALQAAMATNLVKSRPQGLETTAGDRGTALSGGERQRLCIARALLRKPRLLILDEATNAVDAALEQAIMANLSAMRDRFSILFVTHRNETLKFADRIVELESP